MVRKIKLFSVCFEQWTAVHMYRFWYGKARLPFIHFVTNNFEWKIHIKSESERKCKGRERKSKGKERKSKGRERKS